MKNYKVVAATCICVEQREKLPNGTIKPESYFLPAQLADLLRRKFIAETDEQPEAAKVPAGGNDAGGAGDELSKMSKLDLQNLCNEKGIPFAPTATKAELIKLLQTPAGAAEE